MKILASGVTAPMSAEEKAKNKVYNLTISQVVWALRKEGHTVDWRLPLWGEDLSQYDAVLFGYMDPTSWGSSYLLNLLWAHKSHPNLVLYYEDTKKTFEVIGSIARRMKKGASGLRDSTLNQFDYVKEVYGWDNVANDFLDIFEKFQYGNGGIFPTYAKAPIEKMGTFFGGTIFYDHTPIAYGHLKENGYIFECQTPYDQKEDAIFHPALLNSSWVEKTFAKFSTQEKLYRIGYSKPPQNLKENEVFVRRITELEIFENYFKRVKVVVNDPYRIPGIIRARLLFAATCGNAVIMSERDASIFGETWVAMSHMEPKDLFKLTPDFLAKLRQEFWLDAWSYERAIETIIKKLTPGGA